MTRFVQVHGDTTVHVIGKCPVKGCKARRRITVPGKVKSDRLRTWTEWHVPTDDARYAGLLRPGCHVNHDARPSRFPVHYGAYERSYLAAMKAVGWVCDEHDRWFTLNAVKGVHNADKTCNARCVAATGMDCECSCAGQQHGAAYA
jgi:hypothetical protein